MKFGIFRKSETKKKTKKLPKVLVLGSSNSGKSTIISQMAIIDGHLFKREEREEMKKCLALQGIQSLKVRLFNYTT